MTELISVYQRVIAEAQAKREASKNSFWEDFKRSRVDPVVQRLQEQVRRASGPRGCFA